MRRLSRSTVRAPSTYVVRVRAICDSFRFVLARHEGAERERNARKGDNHARVRRRERGRRGRVQRVTANVARLRLGTRRLCGAVCSAPTVIRDRGRLRTRALSLSLSLSLSLFLSQPRRSNRARGRDCQFYVQLIGTLRVGSNGVTAAVVDVDIA